jgi:hypothetical protein
LEWINEEVTPLFLNSIWKGNVLTGFVLNHLLEREKERERERVCDWVCVSVIGRLDSRRRFVYFLVFEKERADYIMPVGILSC